MHCWVNVGTIYNDKGCASPHFRLLHGIVLVIFPVAGIRKISVVWLIGIRNLV